MEVIVRPSTEEACKLVARLIAHAVGRNPKIVLGLATGNTQIPVYLHLQELYRTKQIDFSDVTTFNLDEFIGIPGSHKGSFRNFMEENLFRHVNLNPMRCFIPNGASSDLERECEVYEEQIRNAGGIDLQLLGLGVVGHIGFNEPLSSLASRTRAKSLTPDTRREQETFFQSGEVPSRAITMGVGTILESKRCILFVTGERKADVLARTVEGPITAAVTASALQLHRYCTVVTDEAAAKNLVHRDYYDWVFQNEPEWESERKGS